MISVGGGVSTISTPQNRYNWTMSILDSFSSHQKPSKTVQFESLPNDPRTFPKKNKAKILSRSVNIGQAIRNCLEIIDHLIKKKILIYILLFVKEYLIVEKSLNKKSLYSTYKKAIFRSCFAVGFLHETRKNHEIQLEVLFML